MISATRFATLLKSKTTVLIFAGLVNFTPIANHASLPTSNSYVPRDSVRLSCSIARVVHHQRIPGTIVRRAKTQRIARSGSQIRRLQAQSATGGAPPAEGAR